MSCQKQNISARGQMRKQAAFLNDITNLMSKRLDVIGGKRRSFETDLSAVRPEQANDESKQC